ncbi:MAG: SDR family NAD(P)-dependent oxidoreductase [Myxococcota bacterium]
MLITGGSGGLGTAVTALFLEREAQVTVPVANERQQAYLRKALGDDAQRVAQPHADLLDEGDVQRMIDGMPRVDAVVHLVGGFAVAMTRSVADEVCDLDITANRAAMGEDEAHKWVAPRRLAEAIAWLASEGPRRPDRWPSTRGYPPRPPRWCRASSPGRAGPRAPTMSGRSSSMVV